MCTDHAHFKVGVEKKVFNFLLICFCGVSLLTAK